MIIWQAMLELTRAYRGINLSMNREQPKNNLAVVSGAAHRLGKAIAVGLAQQGYAIGLHYHGSTDLAQQTAIEIQQMGVPVLLLPADLTDERQVVELFEQVATSEYLLKVLVNSASIMKRSDLYELSVEEWNETLNLNLRAPWLCARQAGAV